MFGEKIWVIMIDWTTIERGNLKQILHAARTYWNDRGNHPEYLNYRVIELQSGKRLKHDRSNVRSDYSLADFIDAYKYN